MDSDVQGESFLPKRFLRIADGKQLLPGSPEQIQCTSIEMVPFPPAFRQTKAWRIRPSCEECSGRRDSRSPKANNIWGRKMPPLPIGDAKIIIMQRKVKAHEAEPRSTWKGIIRGIERVPVQRCSTAGTSTQSPLALRAKTIKNMRYVVVVLDVYKTQTSAPLQRKLCRGGGFANPDERHKYDPKFKLCSGRPFTATKECNKWCQMPYPVRRRHEERFHTSRSKSPAFNMEEQQLRTTACHPSDRRISASRSSSPPDPVWFQRRPAEEQELSLLSWANRVTGSSGTGHSQGPRNKFPEQAMDAEVVRP
ncbi:hypothetical protein HPB50_017908 [Hyalomma asiaticum]|uniref:Uncharacterized protein n=1 Tax=Hyalomma asiaticum TaxID=266040 RepID=A0ACB7RUT2_HYAAI|nr:hypothetical protein HPB50_017908 [Hyalomma asiaticum]